MQGAIQQKVGPELPDAEPASPGEPLRPSGIHHVQQANDAASQGESPVGTPRSRDATLVTTAVGMLRADLTVSRGKLAKLLGVSASKLGKAFRAQTGEAFVDFRNKLRLEQFFTLVRPGGGNVSEAAHCAGFGSYAQFHRVFRAQVGTSPKEYVRSTAPAPLAPEATTVPPQPVYSGPSLAAHELASTT